MYRRPSPLVALTAGGLILGLLAWWTGLAPVSSRTTPSAAEADPIPPPPPAVGLRVRPGVDSKEASLLDPQAREWQAAVPTRVLLSRTPRIYQTEDRREAPPPALEVRGLRGEERTLFRLAWTDPTRDAPSAPPPGKPVPAPEGGRLPRRPTLQTTAFADAAAVMVPDAARPGTFPSLVMGDRQGPVRLYYWNASRGAEVLTGLGRARVEAAGQTLRHQARHGAAGWVVTLELPRLPADVPVAFAVWDGSTGDRNGIKFFSVWYVLE